MAETKTQTPCQWWGPLLITPFPQEEKEKRRLEQLERKKETQRLLEEEDSKLKGGKAPRVAAPSKVTRAQIEETLRRDHQHKEAPEPGGAAAHSGAAVLSSKGQAVGLTLAESRAPSQPQRSCLGCMVNLGWALAWQAWLWARRGWAHTREDLLALHPTSACAHGVPRALMGC